MSWFHSQPEKDAVEVAFVSVERFYMSAVWLHAALTGNQPLASTLLEIWMRVILQETSARSHKDFSTGLNSEQQY